jgi:hypothetical protein
VTGSSNGFRHQIPANAPAVFHDNAGRLLLVLDEDGRLLVPDDHTLREATAADAAEALVPIATNPIVKAVRILLRRMAALEESRGSDT